MAARAKSWELGTYIWNHGWEAQRENSKWPNPSPVTYPSKATLPKHAQTAANWRQVWKYWGLWGTSSRRPHHSSHIMFVTEIHNELSFVGVFWSSGLCCKSQNLWRVALPGRKLFKTTLALKWLCLYFPKCEGHGCVLPHQLSFDFLKRKKKSESIE